MVFNRKSSHNNVSLPIGKLVKAIAHDAQKITDQVFGLEKAISNHSALADLKTRLCTEWDAVIELLRACHEAGFDIGLVGDESEARGYVQIVGQSLTGVKAAVFNVLACHTEATCAVSRLRACSAGQKSPTSKLNQLEESLETLNTHLKALDAGTQCMIDQCSGNLAAQAQWATGIARAWGELQQDVNGAIATIALSTDTLKIS